MKSNRLPILATQINSEHAAAAAAIKKGIAHVLAAGDALLEAKALVSHGQWATWLTEYTSLSERSAQRYMQLAKERPTLEAKTATVAVLTIRAACELIAKVPEPISAHVEAWRLAPPDGHSLFALLRTKAGVDFIIITPSAYPNYFYVTHIWISAAVDNDGIPRDSTMTALQKPVRWQALPEVVMLVAGQDVSRVAWETQPFTGRTDHSPWQIADQEGMEALCEVFFP